MSSSHLEEHSSALQETTGHLRLMSTGSPVRSQQAKRAKSSSKGKSTHEKEQGSTSNTITIADAIEDYLQDHIGGNRSPKTLEWHATALGLLRSYLEEKRSQTRVVQIEANDISAWFTYLRKVPARGASHVASGRFKPMLALPVPSSIGSSVAEPLSATRSIASSFPKWVGHSSRPSLMRSSSGSYKPVLPPMNRGRW